MKTERNQVDGMLPAGKEQVRLGNVFHAKYRGFAIFLICCGLLLAAFAVSAVWLQNKDADFFQSFGTFWKQNTKSPSLDEEGGQNPDDTGSEGTEQETNPAPDELTEIPAGATPIVSMDLSYPMLGKTYIHNETIYSPNVAELLTRDVACKEKNPTVLILHTHTSEAYLPEGTAYVEGSLGNATYSREATQNVLAVGEVLCEVLEQKGITAIHCTVMHDDPTVSGAYSRMEKTLKQYLETYPEIALVIDLHRDAVTTSDGKFVRAVGEADGESVAQVMPLVGSNGNGTQYDNWEENLALALQLREQLNANGASVCRPVSLRNASFHQELAARALLLEIGTGGNSVEEAKRAAVLVGQALATLLQS